MKKLAEFIDKEINVAGLEIIEEHKKTPDEGEKNKLKEELDIFKEILGIAKTKRKNLEDARELQSMEW